VPARKLPRLSVRDAINDVVGALDEAGAVVIEGLLDPDLLRPLGHNRWSRGWKLSALESLVWISLSPSLASHQRGPLLTSDMAHPVCPPTVAGSDILEGGLTVTQCGLPCRR
jgi:hypothetical protein